MEKRNISQAPAGVDDDWFIIKYALDNDSYIITNDLYRDYKEKYTQYKRFIESHLIHYNILGNHVSFQEGFEEKLKKIMGKDNMIPEI